LVHTIENWIVPQKNAVIHVLSTGIVHVLIATHESLQNFQSDKILTSKTLYGLDFECIDGCKNSNIEAHLQLWDTYWGKRVGYTHYLIDHNIHDVGNIKSLWFCVNGIRT
jgi:hypothetical protein